MRIVVKLGTSTLAHKSGQLNIFRVEEICKVLSDVKNAGHDVVIVSSGAIGMGLGKLSLSEKPKDVPAIQAVAAVGQCTLMYFYDKMFTEYNHTVAQLLITGADLRSEERGENFRNTLDNLLSMHVIPIINENDTVGTEEIVIGDNDTLAGIVARAIKADVLIMLSDIDGLYTASPEKDPNAQLIAVVPEITPYIEQIAGGAGTKLGTGGMSTKIRAAKIVTEAGIPMIIINGTNPLKIFDAVEGKQVGTLFCAQKKPAE